MFTRYPKRGKTNFVVSRRSTNHDFELAEQNSDNLEQLKLRCSILSEVLYWKTLFLLIAIYICLGTILFIFVLLVYALV